MDAAKVTDVFLDFDGTLTASNKEGVSGYVLPLLERCRGLRVSDCAQDPQGSEGSEINWSGLDERMAAAADAVDFSDSSVLGSREVREQLQNSLQRLVSSGIRVHLLTMGTPQTSKALLGAAGYNLDLFSSFLGPADMARNQSLRHLFENGDKDGMEAAEGFWFDVQDDIDALHHLQKTGEQNPLLQRIMSMEKRLSKAALILSIAGKNGVLVDDNYSKNIFDAHEKDVMYIHIDPEGVLSTNSAMKRLVNRVEACTDQEAGGRSPKRTRLQNGQESASSHGGRSLVAAAS